MVQHLKIQTLAQYWFFSWLVHFLLRLEHGKQPLALKNLPFQYWPHNQIHSRNKSRLHHYPPVHETHVKRRHQSSQNLPIQGDNPSLDGQKSDNKSGALSRKFAAMTPDPDEMNKHLS